jgi:copper homeostasis protein
MMKMTLEIACFTVNGILTAQKAGADRIEFCENPYEGGTTPSYGALKVLEPLVHIPVFPIIRPRGGDFLYSREEFEIIKHDVLICRELGYEGIVIGLLNKDGTIDTGRLKQLVDIAYPMEVTFHRAFDRCADPLKSLEEIIDSGCQRILTSGQRPTAPEGETLIKELVRIADGRIIIMPGSGVNSSNIINLFKETGAKEFHASARTPNKGNMDFEVAEMKEDLAYMDVDAIEVKAMKFALEKG